MTVFVSKSKHLSFRFDLIAVRLAFHDRIGTRERSSWASGCSGNLRVFADIERDSQPQRAFVRFVSPFNCRFSTIVRSFALAVSLSSRCSLNFERFHSCTHSFELRVEVVSVTAAL